MAVSKQLETITLTGTIKVVTGLHIGAGSDTIEIGGMDNPIVKHPRTGEPYIPGSSIKGKLRSLIEWRLVPGKILDAHRTGKKIGEACDCGEPDCPSCVVFGVSAGDDLAKAQERGPTRIVVRDAFLTDYWKRQYAGGEELVEAKNENSINRITARANPRPVERVIPGVEFDLEIGFRVFASDRDNGEEGAQDRKWFNDVVLRGLALLQKDYLGGGGSRGNGRISFKNLKTQDGTTVTLPKE